MKAALALLLAACWTSRAPAPLANTAPPAPSAPPEKLKLCEQLLEHIVDLEFAKSGGDPAVAASVRDQVVAAKAAEFTRTCVDRTPRERVECAIAAADLDALARCDSP